MTIIDRQDRQHRAEIPAVFARWFAGRGWQMRPHQREMLAHAAAGRSALLIAPTGAGKTLAGFLPALIDLAGTPDRPPGIHTLYVSPLKALAVDIARNLEQPIAEMHLDVTCEVRSGDTPANRRRRQLVSPPDILLTTPEQIALLIANSAAARTFESLRYIVLDELHALAASKRGDLLSLGLARLQNLAPQSVRIGLSATVAEPAELAEYLISGRPGDGDPARIIIGGAGARPEITILASRQRIPCAGHFALYAMADIYAALKAHA
ncbi:MAG: DEAD/DEAH box helicase, partial [Hyphomicrobiales bacterium]